MGDKIEPNGDFVEEWLGKRRSEGELDGRILGLVDKCRTANRLREEDLLHLLIEISSAQEGEGEAN